jgi:hypothetical protein
MRLVVGLFAVLTALLLIAIPLALIDLLVGGIGICGRGPRRPRRRPPAGLEEWRA